VQECKCLGLARTIYIRCIYGIFDREITKYTVIRVYIYGSGQPYKGAMKVQRCNEGTAKVQ